MTDYRFSDSPSGPTLFDQPVEPPSVAVDTSMDAAASLPADWLQGKRRQVLAAVIASGGLTCDEVEQQLGLRHQTAAARLWELDGNLLVEKSDQRRPTRSGRTARVYQATALGRDALRNAA